MSFHKLHTTECGQDGPSSPGLFTFQPQISEHSRRLGCIRRSRPSSRQSSSGDSTTSRSTSIHELLNEDDRQSKYARREWQRLEREERELSTTCTFKPDLQARRKETQEVFGGPLKIAGSYNSKGRDSCEAHRGQRRCGVSRSCRCHSLSEPIQGCCGDCDTGEEGDLCLRNMNLRECEKAAVKMRSTTEEKREEGCTFEPFTARRPPRPAPSRTRGTITTTITGYSDHIRRCQEAARGKKTQKVAEERLGKGLPMGKPGDTWVELERPPGWARGAPPVPFHFRLDHRPGSREASEASGCETGSSVGGSRRPRSRCSSRSPPSLPPSRSRSSTR